MTRGLWLQICRLMTWRQCSRLLCLATLPMLALADASISAAAIASAPHAHAVRQHYAQLLAASPPRVAELTLFANRLPKGADLHHHYSGAIYAETYLDWVGAQSHCVFSVTDKALDIEKFRIATQPDKLSPEARKECLSAEQIKDNKNNAFYRLLLQTWSDKDYENHSHDQLPPDQQFFNTFGYFSPVASANYQEGLRQLKDRAMAENLGYLETMLAGAPAVDKPELDPLNLLRPDSSAADTQAALARACEALAADPEAKAKIDTYVRGIEALTRGMDDERFKLRFQTYVSRGNPPARVFASLYSAFVAASSTPMVVGVNIVGPENGIVAMRDYRLHMRMFAFLKQKYPQVKLALHAGELALGMVPPEGLRFHIHEAVHVAGAQRIGHGIDIAHEDQASALLRQMRERGIAVEINLTSNAFILGVKNEAHPIRLYQRHGVPFVISTDDAGVSRNNLSGEYLLYITRYRPSYEQLKATVYNSIRYSFLSEAEKREERARLDRRFAEFEREVAGWGR